MWEGGLKLLVRHAFHVVLLSHLFPSGGIEGSGGETGVTDELMVIGWIHRGQKPAQSDDYLRLGLQDGVTPLYDRRQYCRCTPNDNSIIHPRLLYARASIQNGVSWRHVSELSIACHLTVCLSLLIPDEVE